RRGCTFTTGSSAEPDLTKPASLTNPDRKGLWHDLDENPAVISGRHRVEQAAFTRDRAHKHVQPAGRTFRADLRLDILRQRQSLHRRNKVDAASFENRAFRQVHRIEAQL